MRIRNRKTYFSTLPEGDAPGSRTQKLSTLLYFSFLGFIILYILYYIAIHLVSFERKGQVDVERHLIYSETDGTIEQIYVRKNDSVNRSQLLVTVRPSSFGGSVRNPYSPEAKYRSSLLDKILRLDNDIRMADIDLERARNEYRQLKDQKNFHSAVDRHNRLLELNINQKELSDLEKEIDKVQLKLLSLAATRQSLVKYKNAILQHSYPGTGEGGEKKPPDDPEAILNALKSPVVVKEAPVGSIYAPVKGSIRKLFKSENSQVFSGEAIMTLRPANGAVKIHGFFKNSQIKYIKKGKTVEITFPDDSKSTGTMGQHYTVATSYREKIREDYTPVTSDVLVEIHPLDDEEAGHWRKFDRMNVRLRIRK